jgi:intracellular septation protein
MSLLLDFAPLLAFFVAYRMAGVYTATAVLMISMCLVTLIGWLRTRKLPPMLATSTVLVLLFGTATLVLRNARFIQWKPSVFLWLMAIAFFGSIFIGKQPLAQRVMQPALGEEHQLDRSVWLRANAAWIVFCLVVGTMNLLLAYNTSEATWVKLHIVGLYALLIPFLAGQAWWLLSRTRTQETTA